MCNFQFFNNTNDFLYFVDNIAVIEYEGVVDLVVENKLVCRRWEYENRGIRISG